jgi:hypothetical protein
MAASAAMLAWSYLEHGKGYTEAKADEQVVGRAEQYDLKSVAPAFLHGCSGDGQPSPAYVSCMAASRGTPFMLGARQLAPRF